MAQSFWKFWIYKDGRSQVRVWWLSVGAGYRQPGDIRHPLQDPCLCRTRPAPATASAKAIKAKRPELSADVSDEDWAYFMSRWEHYKKAANVTGDNVVTQLMDCCNEQLRREHHRRHLREGYIGRAEAYLSLQEKLGCEQSQARADEAGPGSQSGSSPAECGALPRSVVTLSSVPRMAATLTSATQSRWSRTRWSLENSFLSSELKPRWSREWSILVLSLSRNYSDTIWNQL